MSFTETIWSLIFGLVNSLFRSCLIVQCSYLIKYHNCNPGQVGIYPITWSIIYFPILILLNKDKTVITKYVDVAKYLFCYKTETIDPLVNKSGKYLIIRSIIATLSSQFCFIAMIYIQSGDFVTVRNVIVLLLTYFMSTYIFKAAPSLITLIISVPCCIVGIILIDQPNFIFSFSKDTTQLSWLGFLFTILCGATRACSDYCTKKCRGIHFSIIGWYSAICQGIWSIVLLIICYYVYGFKLWATFDTFLPNFCLYFGMPICILGYYVGNILAFQRGNIFQLSIIITVTEVLLCYLLDYAWLKTPSNYLTYIGCVIICVTILPVNYDIFKMRRNVNKPKAVKQDKQDYNHEYEVIPDPPEPNRQKNDEKV